MKKEFEGAESVLLPEKFAGLPALKKLRVEKKYRPSLLDNKIREGRTRVEARLLCKAKEAGVRVPFVYAVGGDYIVIERLDAITLNKIEGRGKHWKGKKSAGALGEKKISAKHWRMAGEYLAKLHSHGIAHGDYTPANLMLGKGGKLYVIDFGLGFSSFDEEDFAVDLLTMKNSLSPADAKEFVSGYLKLGKKSVFARMEKVQKRARYQEREPAE
ncbi:Kae1-associated kinase Bud32 [Candidatus Micrarchaeota archaeon CG10_big_fil_rev_8_21_14_0_10_45_29]|nr:MAG: Kae1-associated kinase Bud32 [Candidatus Micrarchaeota archaeon CG10_big_fil_rev_8_21_14_0_10_45_29]